MTPLLFSYIFSIRLIMASLYTIMFIYRLTCSCVLHSDNNKKIKTKRDYEDRFHPIHQDKK